MADRDKKSEFGKPRVPPPPALGGFPSPQSPDRTDVAPNPLQPTTAASDDDRESSGPGSADGSPADPDARPGDPGQTEVVEDAPTGPFLTAAPEPVEAKTTERATVGEPPQAAQADGGAPQTGSESSGAKKPPSLPRPQRLGASKPASDFRDARPPVPSSSSGTSSVPKGIKPPPSAAAVPAKVEAEDTDVLIASVADAMALEAEQDAARAAAERAAAEIDAAEAAASNSAGIAATSGSAQPVPLPSPDPVDDEDEFGPRPAWIPWAAVGGVVAVVLIAFVAWPSGDPPSDIQADVATEEPAQSEPNTEDSSLAAAEVQRDEPTPIAAKVGEPDVEPAVTPDVGGGDDPMAESADTDTSDEGSDSPIDSGEPTGEPTADEAAAEPQDASPGSGSKRKRRGHSRKGTKSTPAPQPKPKPKPKPQSGGSSADALLGQARSALAKGRASEAYRLASQSYTKARSSSALKVMAKAGCKMGNKSKAKRAFDKLSVGQRAGIRSECRKHGVKLGL